MGWWRLVRLGCREGEVGGTILVIGLLDGFGEGRGVQCESD